MDFVIRLVNKFLPKYASELMRNSPRRSLAGLVLLCLILCVSARPAEVAAQGIKTPDAPAATMALDEIRIGMKGYGMTVFHGTKIEPFNVEVVSIIPNSVPKQTTVWVRCKDPRMVESGPVQGMSGSPIYLWDEGEPQELGKGGRLIGAFAFGYAESQQCLVGVQPIEYMRNSASRVSYDESDGKASANRRVAPGHVA